MLNYKQICLIHIPQHYLAFAGLPAFAFKAKFIVSRNYLFSLLKHCHYLNYLHSVITQFQSTDLHMTCVKNLKKKIKKKILKCHY
ncbi:hypothetical protein BpHYR1_046918 [Brachionus plicatilis]|uniref:Uncharacterized protein n=1 Tax=Brachionus plicatilis TaxID=10195 RepID=A0A3M7SM11_BRAPC|nr:hypothetical protein BpHYR1_046918 [Brachionus plicatilis]